MDACFSSNPGKNNYDPLLFFSCLLYVRTKLILNCLPLEAVFGIGTSETVIGNGGLPDTSSTHTSTPKFKKLSGISKGFMVNWKIVSAGGTGRERG